ncbi:MAG: hypothetical protein OXR67_05680 [Chloroflexota bacterium]|nr:hypothetical protein [Chloroflexota bacterium]
MLIDSVGPVGIKSALGRIQAGLHELGKGNLSPLPDQVPYFMLNRITQRQHLKMDNIAPMS